MSVTDLNHAVRHLCHVVDVCSKLLKDFHDYCLFNMSDQLFVGIEKLQKYSFALQHSQKAVLLPRRVTQLLKNGLNEQQWRLHHCKIPPKNL